MSEVKNFDSMDELEAWLKFRGVAQVDASAAANVLYPDFNEQDALLGISTDDLKFVGLSIPLAMKLSNKLKNENLQPQQIPQQDVSLAWEARVSTAIPDLSSVTTTEQIKDFVFAPPNSAACVLEHDFQKWKSGVTEDALRPYFRPVSTHETCERLAFYLLLLLAKTKMATIAELISVLQLP